MVATPHSSPTEPTARLRTLASDAVEGRVLRQQVAQINLHGARRYIYPMEVAGAQLLRYQEDAGRVVMDGEYFKEIWGEWLIHPDRGAWRNRAQTRRGTGYRCSGGDGGAACPKR